MQVSKQQGFSLIELLVVVAIVGVLATAGVVGYTKYIYSTKVALNERNMYEIAKALDMEAVRSSICVDDARIDSQNDGNNIFRCIARIVDNSKITNPFTGNPYVGLATYNLPKGFINGSQAPTWDATGIPLDDPSLTMYSYFNCDHVDGSPDPDGGIAVLYQSHALNQIILAQRIWLGTCLNTSNSDKPSPTSQIIGKVSQKLKVSNY